jgi:hypothetical protein
MCTVTAEYFVCQYLWLCFRPRLRRRQAEALKNSSLPAHFVVETVDVVPSVAAWLGRARLPVVTVFSPEVKDENTMSSLSFANIKF